MTETWKELAYLNEEIDELLKVGGYVSREVKSEEEKGARPLRLLEIEYVILEKTEELLGKWNLAFAQLKARDLELRRVLCRT